MNRLSITLLVALLFAGRASADEGLWMPSLIGKQIESMRAAGSQLSADDIYNPNDPSLKDAIVQFAGGCTGEVVSTEGLVFTNHHCGYSQIQSHSTLENDYLTHGFAAMSRAQELPNPGLTVKFLVSMEDVTGAVLKGVKDKMDAKKREELIKKNTKVLNSKAIEGTNYTSEVKAMYYGNQYYLYIYETFRDVRLVLAPHSSIGKFGGETDNWIWPRHTGDFAVFRIYADKDNKPADYSRDNIPYRPKKHIQISTAGVRDGDFTMIYGYPGTTNEYLLSDAVDFIQNYSDPAKIGLRTQRLNVINNAMRMDRQTRIMYSVKAANIANAWKKWQGEVAGLKRLGTIEKKREMESRFEVWAGKNPSYKAVIPRMRELYAELHDYAFARDYYNEAAMGVEALKFYSTYRGKRSQAARDEEADKFFKDYIHDIDMQIAGHMLTQYLENVPEKFVPQDFRQSIEDSGGLSNYINSAYNESALASREKFDLLVQDSTTFAENLKSDPLAQLQKQFADMYNNKISSKYSSLNKEITALYSTYMRGLMEFSPDTNFYPDANSTMRVAYGKVKSYKYSDAVIHLPVTTIEGIMEKDNPDNYDYDIPQRMRDVYSAKDYGTWETDSTVPVCFIATNHTSGGNSGSPILNAKGELVGINFDRTWLSTMSDIEFDDDLCRNISVDVRYILFCIDKISGAGYLLDELGVR